MKIEAIASDAGEFLTQMNQGLYAILQQAHTTLFASAFYLVIDVARGEARYANAGEMLDRLLDGSLQSIDPNRCRQRAERFRWGSKDLKNLYC